jgi:hypothetical protein
VMATSESNFHSEGHGDSDIVLQEGLVGQNLPIRCHRAQKLGFVDHI